MVESARSLLWTVTLNQPIVFNAELLDYVCLENEKDIAHMVGK